MNASAPPAELAASLSQAKDVVLCIAGGDFGDVLNVLRRHVTQPYRVSVIWNHSDLDRLEELLRRGYHVFQGVVAGPSRLYVGRSRGYKLPAYERIGDAFVRACQDWGRRSGTYLLVSGRVGAVYAGHELFQLQGREHFFISVASTKLPLPEPGCEIEVVLNCPWASSRTLLASAERILVRSPARSAP
jgi:hypothetical protein